LEPTKIKPKSHIVIKSLLIALGSLLTPLLLLILITQYNVSRSPSSITPSEEFCLDGYFIFPDNYKVRTVVPVNVRYPKTLTLFNKFDVFAKQVCITPTALLPQNASVNFQLTYLDEIDWNIFQKNIQLTTQSYPQLSEIEMAEEINQDEILRYKVDYFSNLLDYSLASETSTVVCTKDNDYVLCDISDLKLEQGGSYQLNLIAKYKGERVEDLGELSAHILSAVEVTSSSVQDKQKIQSSSVPEITLTLNKAIMPEFKASLTDSLSNPITLVSVVTGNILSIKPQASLTQGSTYFLKLNDLTGLDGSHIAGEYVLEFSIDDGPQIKSTNMGTGFSTSGNIVLTFNQDIKAQNVKAYVKFTTGLDYSYSIYKNQITINPNNNFDSCQSYSLSIAKGLLSTTDLVSTKSYTYTLKTKCERVASIGTSVQGRPIYASYFGTGSKRIIFFGAMHGSESNTKTMLNKWIVELESNSAKIPSDKTIIVIPTLNPDGVANRVRFNANGVDLNRNFGSSTWVSGTYFLSNFYPTGGGASPFSEPESVAIRDFVNNNAPYLTVSYHSAAGCVIPTSSSYGVQLGQIYSQLSGYSYVNPGGAGAFTYDITGTFEEWADESGKNALVVELSSLYADQFTQNKAAMWKMVTE